MRFVAAGVLLASLELAHAEPTAPVEMPRMTIGASVFMAAFPTSGFHFAWAARVTHSYYVDGQASFGAKIRSEDHIVSEDLWSAQIGASSIRWSEYSAVGARESVGYMTNRADYTEGIIGDWTENHTGVFAETAVFARLRCGPTVALELLAAVRFGLIAPPFGHGPDVTGYVSTGLHITL